MPQPDHCIELVRTHDRDRYLSTLYAPATKHPALFALYALNVEIERIPHLVNEPQIGEIRMQWWTETLDAIARGEKSDHPTAAACAEANLPTAPLQRLIEARRFDLYADHMPSLNDLEGYLGETQSILFQLASQIISPENASPELSGLAGVAYGLARIVNWGDPRFVPKDQTPEALSSLALRRLQEIREKPHPKILLPAFLPVTLTDKYLNKKQKPLSDLSRQWHIWRAARKESL